MKIACNLYFQIMCNMPTPGFKISVLEGGHLDWKMVGIGYWSKYFEDNKNLGMNLQGSTNKSFKNQDTIE